MNPDRRAVITLDGLAGDAYKILADLRVAAPVEWVPAIAGWLVTSHAAAVEVIRDAEAFTVDDRRFSTARVLGPSMLSLDGPEHDRHRRAFAPAFRAESLRGPLEDRIDNRARRLVEGLVAAGRAEMRTALAGPLAVDTIVDVLGLEGVEPATVRGWYETFADAIVAVTRGEALPEAATFDMDQIRHGVASTLAGTGPSVVRTASLDGRLETRELTSDVAVLMFGAIETSEGMIANLLWHLLSDPDTLDRVAADRRLAAAAIEESLRLEPAAAVVDRYATRDLDLQGAAIARGDLVRVSLLAANRDPEIFADPDRFHIDRPDAHHHLAFAQGPHRCLGAHLARAETEAAIGAVLDVVPDIVLDSELSEPPRGLVFRKPQAVVARWSM